MTAAEKRAKNKKVWEMYPFLVSIKKKIPDVVFYSTKRNHCFNYNKFVTKLNNNERNSNKRLITYLNRKARAEHMKAHGKTPKHVPTIREMYLNSK